MKLLTLKNLSHTQVTGHIIGATMENSRISGGIPFELRVFFKHGVTTICSMNYENLLALHFDIIHFMSRSDRNFFDCDVAVYSLNDEVGE